MRHTFLKKVEGNRKKGIYYAPLDVHQFIKAQSKKKCLSKSEIIVRTIQESWDFKRRNHATR